MAEIVLSTGRLRWSSPLRFNDPAEFRRMPRFVPSLEVVGGQLIETLVDLAQGVARIDEARLSPSCRVLLLGIRTLVSNGYSRPDVIRQLGFLPDQPDQLFEARLTEFVEALTLQAARVLCVTTKADNELMWQEYAEGHRGAVLSFRHLREHDTPLLAAKPVEYCGHPPDIGSGLDSYCSTTRRS